MIRMARPASVAALVLTGAAVVSTHFGPAMAQTRVPIKFEHGASSAAVGGSVTGHEYADYVLGARAGQTMSVGLKVNDTNGDGTVYINVLPPGSDDVAIYIGSDSEDGHGEVKLPESGDYTVRVYLMGNDKDAGKTVGYTLEATIR